MIGQALVKALVDGRGSNAWTQWTFRPRFNPICVVSLSR